MKYVIMLLILSIVVNANDKIEKYDCTDSQETWGRSWDQGTAPVFSTRATPYFWNFESDSAFERIPYYALTWQWGIPTSGPGSAYSGLKCWATNLSGDYTNNCDWRLTMPAQDFTTASNPQLQFYQWYSTEAGYDSGWVEVSTDNGGSWLQISPSYRGSSGEWVLASIDLTAYAGMSSVLLRFRFKSDASSVYPGWYLDDVRVIGGVTYSAHLYQNSFEGTNGDLSTILIGDSVAPWQRGIPTSGPPSAYDGSECWGTNLSGYYNNYADEAIRNGTNFDLQSATYGEINFYQWYATETGYDSGWVEVSTSGQNGPWSKVSPSYRGSSGGWLRTTVDISPYTSTNRFRFRFRFKSDGSANSYAGWYIDSVRVSTGTVSTIGFYDFEANDGGFVPDPPSGDVNEWHCGTPTSGPNGAYSGTMCWATDLAGDYENNAEWLLMTPVCDLTGFAVASLQLAQWYSTESGIDLCIIEISSDGGGNWDTLVTRSGVSGGWKVDTFDVTPFVSAAFRARFRFTSNGSVVYPGWYIDDVRIDTVGGYIAQDPVKLATNWIALYVSNDVTSDPGTYTAATEAGHSYGADVTLLYGGGAHNPWSSYSTVRSYRTNTDYVTRSSGAVSPYDTVSLVRFYHGARFTDSRTLLQTWEVTNGQDDFLLKQRYTTQYWNDSSGLGISLVLVNKASQNRTFSFRYQWDTHVDTYDSPYFRRYYSLTPNAWEPREVQWSGLAPLWFAEESDDSLSTRRHFVSVTAPTFYSPAPTCPDSLFYVRWGGTCGGYANAFDVPYMDDGLADSLPGYNDDCVCYMWLNRIVGPNDSIVLSQYLFSPLTLIGTEEADNRRPGSSLVISNSNPLRKGARLSVMLCRQGRFAVKLYSAEGRMVGVIWTGETRAGIRVFSFEGTDGAGRELPTGIYFLVVENEGLKTAEKIVYLK